MTGLDVAPGPDTAFVGSVADRSLVERVFGEAGIDAVIHAGALHKPDIARYPEAAFTEVNVEGTRNLLEAAAGARCRRFVFTSTTSLMISESLHRGGLGRAVWLDEDFGPLAPRNAYGVTKLAAERLCRDFHVERGLPVTVLRTGRFFPEEDDTHRDLSGPNRKANEFLGRRLTVEDAAEAHVAALETAESEAGLYLVAAPTPFAREEAEELALDAPAVIGRHFPEAAGLYRSVGWRLPERIERIYDPSLIEARLGFRCRTGFADVLRALEQGGPLPFVHDPGYLSPQESRRRARV